MEFDKSKVYTAVNADELPIGSKCIFADTIGELKKAVEENGEIETLAHVYSEYEQYRFSVAKPNGGIHSLAYLVVPPKQAKKQKEPKYKPFESAEKAMEAIKKHGGWIKSKDGNKSFFITGFNKKENAFCFVFEHWHSFSFLFAKFVWVDDGSPCGEL